MPVRETGRGRSFTASALSGSGACDPRRRARWGGRAAEVLRPPLREVVQPNHRSRFAAGEMWDL